MKKEKVSNVVDISDVFNKDIRNIGNVVRVVRFGEYEFDDTPKCSDGKELKNYVRGDDFNAFGYCTMHHVLGDSCYHLRIKDNTQLCSYYKRS
jgi:hypothetical protein